MQVNNTYKGFRYQKKCAFLYLLRYFHREDFTHISLEHEEGDDFDLHFQSEKQVFQTKDYKEVTSMKAFLTNMWRRYSENIREKSPENLSLYFVFSRQSNNKAFVALKTRNRTSTELDRLLTEISMSPKLEVPLTEKEWQNFLEGLFLEVIENKEIEIELDRYISWLSDAYDLKKAQKEMIFRSLLDKLDETMAFRRRTSKEEIREQIDVWHRLNFFRHPEARDRAEKLKEDIIIEKLKRPVPTNSIGELP